MYKGQHPTKTYQPLRNILKPYPNYRSHFSQKNVVFISVVSKYVYFLSPHYYDSNMRFNVVTFKIKSQTYITAISSQDFRDVTRVRKYQELLAPIIGSPILYLGRNIKATILLLS